MTNITEDELWDHIKLAKFLNYSPNTVRRMASQTPEKLPPRITHLARLRWLPEVAREWARNNSYTTQYKGGRPRANQVF